MGSIRFPDDLKLMEMLIFMELEQLKHWMKKQENLPELHCLPDLDGFPDSDSFERVWDSAGLLTLKFDILWSENERKIRICYQNSEFYAQPDTQSIH